MTFISKTQRDFVSVLMPVKNGAAYLREAMDSLLSQTYTEFEVIAVDHASTDDSASILKEYSLKDGRVDVFRFGGESFADCLNFGIKNCRGEFIARMDADDVCRPERLALQIEYLDKNSDVGIVGSAVELFGNNGNSVREGYRRYGKWINSLLAPSDIEREIFVESPMPHPSVMIRREILCGRLGGYRDFDGPEDYDLWLRARFAGIKMAKLAQPLLRWRDCPSRLSRRSGRYSRKNFHKLRANYLAKLANGKKVVIQGAGTTGRTLGRYLKKEGANITAYIDINPRRIGGKKLGLPVYPAEAMDSFKGSLLISAVASWGARDLIRGLAEKAGFTEGVDFYCAS
ncbi:MAG: glycosyltransferase [Nitrospinota bacterium]